jgi:hypothetical protein
MIANISKNRQITTKDAAGVGTRPLLSVRPGGCDSPVFASHCFWLKYCLPCGKSSRENRWWTRLADLEYLTFPDATSLMPV